jgi:hypothetical protein
VAQEVVGSKPIIRPIKVNVKRHPHWCLLLYLFKVKEKYKLKDKRIYAGLLIFFALCYAARQLAIPFISDHITNFALSGGILVVTTYTDVAWKGISKASMLSAALFWASVNIVVEQFIRADEIQLLGVTFSNFNTPDSVDAIFGLLGIGLFLSVAFKFGLGKTSIS